MHLIIANKLYSSWSLRPWLLMRALAIPFEETVIPLYLPDTADRIREHSPSGKVPLLIDEGMRVWESLAIVEHLHERHPDKGIWPREPEARAHARAISNEMHAGFQPLRAACAMNLAKRFAPTDHGVEVAACVDRIEAIWREARTRYGAKLGGPFLYGAFSAADAMYAPVVTRFDTYQFAVDADSRAYMDAVLTQPDFVAWRDAALAEPWFLPHYETGHSPVHDYRPAAVAAKGAA